MKIIPRVLDLSHYDDVKDAFAGAKKMGIWGVVNKITEGFGGFDKSYGWREKPLQDAGMLVGTYHFIRPGRILDQARFYLAHTHVTNTLLALDYEDAQVPLEDARSWLEYVHAQTGRWPKLYLGGAVRDQLKPSNKDPFWPNLDLWHPQYNATPSKVPVQWKAPWLWQYTGDGLGPNPHTVPGIKPVGKLDINHFSGSLDELKSRWAA